ncbi:MAG: SlyX family protein [Sphaerochaetaceae bacterium]|nr:SlyX family protein [Sphaerochaetaceae bacterium]
MNDEVEKIEIKCAYLEAQVAELNEVVIEHQKSIDSLLIQLQKLKKKVEELIEESGEARPNRRPPHY